MNKKKTNKKRITFLSKKEREQRKKDRQVNLKRVKSISQKSKKRTKSSKKEEKKLTEKEIEYKLKCKLTKDSGITKEELDILKKSYLSRKKKKDTNITSSGQSSRNILNFEWKESDDTSYDANPLYRISEKKITLIKKGKVEKFHGKSQNLETIRYK
jgi:hypothetical protein